MKNSVKIILLIAVLVTVFVGVYTSQKKTAAPITPVAGTSMPQFDHPLSIGGFAMHVATVSTEAAREQGLSDTDMLAPNQGMLFEFDTEDIPAFWMKDMRYNLDMIWIGADKTVKDISPNATVASYPNTIFRPSVPVKYVLEVPAGFADEHHIQKGTTVSF